MNSKIQVILGENKFDKFNDNAYKISLTKEQMQLLKWLSEHGFLWDDVTYITVDQNEFLPID